MSRKIKHFASLDALYEATSGTADFSFEEGATVAMEGTVIVNSNDDYCETEGMIPFVSRAYHDGTNVNNSTIKDNVFIEKSKSVVFRPVLANIVDKEDGTRDFGAHDTEVYVDEDGNKNIRYLESPIGVITGYDFEYDKVQRVNRAVVNGFLYERYCDDAIEILKNRSTVDCSIELMVNKAHYDADTKTVMLDDYYVTGLTLLGADHRPGMVGSQLTISEYEEESNVFAYFKTLTEEQIARIKEFGSVLFSSPVKDKQKKKGVEGMENEAKSVTLSFSVDTGEEKTFARDITLSDKQWLVTYALWKKEPNADRAIVFDDKVIYSKWGFEEFENKFFRVGYTCDGEEVTFAENVEEVVNRWMTTEEEALMEAQRSEALSNYESKISELEAQVSDYDEIKKKLEAFEAEKLRKEKEAIFTDESYAEFLETDEFKALYEDMDNISLEDLTVKAELAFAKLVKTKKTESTEDKSGHCKIVAPIMTDSDPKKEVYGGIFK